MNENFDLSDSDEMNKRRSKAEEFFRLVFEPDEQPYFVSDEATLYDIYSGEESELIQRCKSHYGVSLTAEQFSWPVWKILDHLEIRATR